MGEDFDGIEFGPLSPLATSYQRKLLFEILEFMTKWAGIETKQTPLPDYILRAFKDKESKGEVK